MTLVPNAIWAAAALLLAADGDIVQETGAQGVFFGRGTVKAVEADDGALTLDHGDIKGCMPAMEMMFRVARPEIGLRLQPGDVVDFALDGGRYVILDARLVRRGDRAPRPQADPN